MNLYDLPTPLPTEEVAEALCRLPGARVERVLSSGQTTGWYDQEEAEFVALLTGEAEITYADGERRPLRAGDWLLLPPHRVHRVSYTSAEPPCVWICVFFDG